jgi:hypothetical protein
MPVKPWVYFTGVVLPGVVLTDCGIHPPEAFEVVHGGATAATATAFLTSNVLHGSTYYGIGGINITNQGSGYKMYSYLALNNPTVTDSFGRDCKATEWVEIHVSPPAEFVNYIPPASTVYTRQTSVPQHIDLSNTPLIQNPLWTERNLQSEFALMYDLAADISFCLNKSVKNPNIYAVINDFNYTGGELSDARVLKSLPTHYTWIRWYTAGWDWATNTLQYWSELQELNSNGYNSFITETSEYTPSAADVSSSLKYRNIHANFIATGNPGFGSVRQGKVFEFKEGAVVDSTGTFPDLSNEFKLEDLENYGFMDAQYKTLTGRSIANALVDVRAGVDIGAVNNFIYKHGSTYSFTP